MANRPKGFGMTAELAKKKSAKFDAGLANECFEWIAAVLKGNRADGDVIGRLKEVQVEKDVHVALKDGVVLCHLANAIKPSSVKKINSGNMAFKQMENVSNFLAVCEDVGCSKTDLFQTVDLYESNNIPQVINGIYALGRKCHKIGGNLPRLGPEESTTNKREFTEEQLRAGDGVIGLQAGSNKGASQAGQNFGKTRHIID